MSVTSQSYSVSYTASGSATSFAYPYYFISQSDLFVQQLTPAGAIINNVLNTDYLIVGTPNTFGDYNNGANVVFNSPPAAGNTINLSRKTPITRIPNYIDNSPLTADQLNHDLDKLTLIEQEEFGPAVVGPPVVTVPPPPFGTILINALPQPGGPAFWIFCIDGLWHPMAVISL